MPSDAKDLTKPAEPVEDVAAIKNRLSSLEAMLEAAKKDPDELLALADLDFDSLTKHVIEGKYKPRDPEARKKMKEAQEIDALRKRAEAAEAREAEREAKARFEAELAELEASVSDEEAPAVRALAKKVLPSILAKKWQDKEGKFDIKAALKEAEDAIFGDVETLLKAAPVRARVKGNAELVAALKEDLGLTTAEAKKVAAKVQAVTSKAADRAAPPAADEKAAKRAKDDEVKSSTISKWLGTKAKKYIED